MRDGKFTIKERAYLVSLPAVKSVSASCIRYSDQFRVEVMRRYRAGESPSDIFREAGLDPKLIGYKRIERCIARWRKQLEREERSGKQPQRYLQDIDDIQVVQDGGSAQDAPSAQTAIDAAQDPISKLAQAQLAINKRDLLIARQALRIDELERVLRKFVRR